MDARESHYFPLRLLNVREQVCNLSTAKLAIAKQLPIQEHQKAMWHRLDPIINPVSRSVGERDIITSWLTREERSCGLQQPGRPKRCWKHLNDISSGYFPRPKFQGTHQHRQSFRNWSQSLCQASENHPSLSIPLFIGWLENVVSAVT